MIRFDCDYATGAHPSILQRLSECNLEENPGYGMDSHCDQAGTLLRNLCQAPDADVHFLVGGTQTNTTVIAACLRPYQGVICAQSGHINVHESGAIESTGHKVLALPSRDGKITAQQIDQFCQTHWDDPACVHVVEPAMVYLSHPTEFGTVYTRQELEEIRSVADRWGLTLYVDGARLVYGLAASDLTLPDLANICDLFYLGGTKAGALFGEALVISNDTLKTGFRHMMKQRGSMLAKGWLLGIQFEVLLSEGRYLQIGRKAVDQAQRMQQAFTEKGWPLYVPAQTNQLFLTIPDKDLAALEDRYAWCFWEKPDADHTTVRFCTTWSTKDSDIQTLIQDIRAL
ncbi:MAG: threonine aldolase family protein [Lawsonibacter sp.]|jgi:threonine aldolase